MPPEPSPWDRKESTFRDRKHDRGPPDGATSGGGGAFQTPRWRDPHRGPRELYSPSPRRPSSGHYKHVFVEETPSRLEDESFRCYSGRYGSSSGRDGSGRDGRGGYLRRSPWNAGGSPRLQSPRLQQENGCVQRSVPEMPKLASSMRSSPVMPTRDHHVKSGGDFVSDGPGTGHIHDRDPDHSLGSISWKTLKWSRPGVLSASSGRDLDHEKPEVVAVAVKDSPVRTQVELLPPAEDGYPRKRQRLGWGQGLAKYEKEKVEGSEANPGKVVSTNQQLCGSISPVVNHAESTILSTDVVGLDHPAVSNPGFCSVPEVTEGKVTDALDASECREHIPTIYSNILPGKWTLDSSINIDELDVSILPSVSSFVTQLLQTEDASPGDLYIARQTDLDKLLSLKEDISKLIEKAEAVIDACEMDLKSLNDNDEETNPTQGLTLHPGVQNNMLSCSYNSDTNDKDLSTSNVELTSCCIQEHPSTNHLIDHDHSHYSTNISQPCLNELQPTEESPGSKEKHVKNAGDSNVGGQNAEIIASKILHEVDHLHVVDSISSLSISHPDLQGKIDFNLGSKILDFNRELAKEASEIFKASSACTVLPFDMLKLDNATDLRIKEKLRVCKRSLRFKERVLTLKFKAFYHLWREDLRLLDLLSVKKSAVKPQRHSEMRFCLPLSGQQKPRSSMRSQLLLPAGSVTLSPTTEILDLTSKLISDPETQIYRENLRMPAMFLDERSRRHSRFITSNGLIEDPIMLEKEKLLINCWTEEEKKIFMEKLVLFGKDFRKIASFLDHKTTADCIEFYYKNHKLESFEAVRKILSSRKQSQSLPSNNYMVASGNKWKNDMSAASLDMLGAASMIISHSNDVPGVYQKFHRNVARGDHASKISSANCAKYFVNGHAETVAADVLASIGCAMSSEGMSSCVTSSVDPVEKLESIPVDHPPFSEVSQPICEEYAFSDEGCGELEVIDWSDDEKSVFIMALRSYGKDFTRIAACLGTRTRDQCRVFFSKVRKSLGLDIVYKRPPMNGDAPLSGDFNECRSDTDEACAADVNSTPCTCSPCSKADEDWPQIELDHQEVAHAVSSCANTVCHEELDAEPLQDFGTTDESRLTVFDVKDVQLAHTELRPSELTAEGSVANHLTLDSHADEQALNGANFLSSCLQGDKLVDENSQVDSKKMPQQLASCSSPYILKTDVSELTESFNVSLELPREKCIDGDSGISFENATNGTTGHHQNYGSFFLDTISDIGHTVQQHMSDLPPLPCKKSQVTLWEQKENSSSAKFLTDSKTVLGGLDQVVLPQKVVGCHDQVVLPQKVDWDGEKNEPYILQSSSYDVGGQSLTGYDHPGHTLRGYETRLLNVCSNELVELHKPVCTVNIKKENNSTVEDKLFLPDLHSGKCNDKPGLFDTKSSMPVCNIDDLAEGLLHPCSQNKEAGKQVAQTGDFKLFGQKILSHPAPLKPDNTEVKISSTEESRILNFQLSNARADGTSDPSNAEISSCMGLAADLQARNSGWWDRHKAQTGFSSFANSAMCLSKCPSVVSGVTYHPKKVKTVKRAGIVHQSLFPADGRRQIIFPESKNGVRIDAMSGLQQQAKVAVNMVGGGDSLGCNVITDPLAALRFHFAKQMTPLGSNEEPHRGDLGSR